MKDSVTTELKKLILDDRFHLLEGMVASEVNLMSILNVAHRELQHSNFLAWLFNPSESHGMDDYFIKEFIKLYFVNNDYADLGIEDGLSVFDFIKLDLRDMMVKREHKKIDLLLLSRRNELVIVIENKIFAKQDKDQLTNYRQYVSQEYEGYRHRIFVYLTLMGQEILHGEDAYYVPITYDSIVEMIDNALAGGVSDNIEFVLAQYLTTIKALMHGNTEIEELAKELYRDYKASFDLVFKYVTPSAMGFGGVVPNELDDLVARDDRVSLLNSTRTYVRFLPKALSQLHSHLVDAGIIPHNYDFNSQTLLGFQFIIRETTIHCQFYIGDYHDQDSRRRLYEHCKHYKTFTTNRQLSDKWTQVARFDIVTKDKLERSLQDDDFDLNEYISQRYERAMSNFVPSVIEALKEI